MHASHVCLAGLACLMCSRSYCGNGNIAALIRLCQSEVAEVPGVLMLSGGCLQARLEELWRATRQQEERRATTPGLLSKLRKNMGSGGSGSGR